MTCRKWQFLLATAEACELEGNVALHTHLAECAQCAQFAREVQAMSRAMRSMPRLSPTSEFGRKVRERIDEETAEAVMPAPLGKLADLWSGPSAMVQPQVAAMALLTLLALLLAYLYPLL